MSKDLAFGQTSGLCPDQKIPMKLKDLFNAFLQLCLWEGFQDSEVRFDS
jgi:hypothetical protein